MLKKRRLSAILGLVTLVCSLFPFTAKAEAMSLWSIFPQNSQGQYGLRAQSSATGDPLTFSDLIYYSAYTWSYLGYPSNYIPYAHRKDAENPWI